MEAGPEGMDARGWRLLKTGMLQRSQLLIVVGGLCYTLSRGGV